VIEPGKVPCNLSSKVEKLGGRILVPKMVVPKESFLIGGNGSICYETTFSGIRIPFANLAI
jgi:hypothetical protein